MKAAQKQTGRALFPVPAACRAHKRVPLRNRYVAGARGYVWAVAPHALLSWWRRGMPEDRRREHAGVRGEWR
ncbi:MAG: hypothetical protein KatS3mg077_0020 [Candidatus Binatia bacterium]|nr:MAG: hypothetical protein KatS3mg077_0020 [Candidatus Binatia bacterium]